jgi:hypothetical protein
LNYSFVQLVFLRSGAKEASKITTTVSSTQMLAKNKSAVVPAREVRVTAPKDVICPGYELLFPKGQSAFSSYPFLLHERLTLPWSIILVGTKLRLRSKSCLKISPSSDPTAATPCGKCAALHNDTIIMGIRHRSLDGAHESTPWAYLSPAQMYEALKRKTTSMNLLKLSTLNIRRTLSLRNRHIDMWKRFAVAVGREDIPRIRSLMAAELRRGSSVFSIVEKVEQAARRAYTPRGYTEAEFQLGFLLYKIGGRAVANLAHRALGVPSIDATKRHLSATPLLSSPGFPTREELETNLSICYPSDEFGPHNGIIEGVQMPIDELKISERLRWDPRTNMILGVCREHGMQAALEYRSQFQADTLLKCLKNKTVHLASEVRAFFSLFVLFFVISTNKSKL